MGFHLLESIGCPKPLLWISNEQVLDEVLAFLRDEPWQLQRCFDDVLVEYIFVRIEIWRNTHQHFVQDGANSIPVDALSVRFVL